MCGKGHSISFDDNNNVVFSSGFPVINIPKWSASNFDGSVKYYTGNFARRSDGNYLYHEVDKKLWGFNHCEARLADSAIILFENVLDTCNSYNFNCTSFIRKTLILTSGASIKVAPAKYKEVLLPQNTFGICTVEDTIGGTWLIARVNSTTFYNFYFNSKYEHDTMVVSVVPSMFSPILDNLTDTTRSETLQNVLEPSPSGNLISASSHQGTCIPGLGYLQEWITSHILRFDKVTGQLFSVKELYSLSDSTINYATKRYIRHDTYTPGEFTSNDQWHYYSYNKYRAKNNSDSTFIFRYNIKEDRIEQLDKLGKYFDNSKKDGCTIYDWKLMNNRELFMYKVSEKDGNWGHSFGVISEPNEVNISLDYHKYFLAGYSAGPMSRSRYNYINVRPVYDYDCYGHVRFRDWCDYSLPNTKVEYFTEDVAGSGSLTARGINPIIDYSISGDYLCKVVLSSHDGAYKEIHFDTLRVRIPPKPVADFIAQDTVVCAFSKIEFLNLSHSTTTNQTNGEKWVWSFGDGITKTLEQRETNVHHIYEKPGVYTVSLFYSNGYCDSTMVKNQYMRVVDSPQPGFTIDNNRGCTPFTVNIIDTITQNTTKKEYNFYDGAGWLEQNVNQNRFSFTYEKAGSYWITQRLYGFTGCVTQKDSVQIFVTVGINLDDSLHLKDATYDLHPSIEGALVTHSDGRTKWVGGEEAIILTWENHPAAVVYEVRRNGENIVRLASGAMSSYVDSVETPSVYTYSAVAFDSCGNQSSIGRIVRPIYLTGKAETTNDLSVIKFTPYVGASREINYQVLVERNGVWDILNPISELGSYSEFIDANFLDNSNLSGVRNTRKCYVIKTDSILSNILCLPYTPVLFLPTAFSPNNDGLNDVYYPVSFGITSYEVEVYDRWGSKITTFTEKENGWQARDVPLGVYVVSIKAQGNDEKWYYRSQRVTLMR